MSVMTPSDYCLATAHAAAKARLARFKEAGDAFLREQEEKRAAKAKAALEVLEAQRAAIVRKIEEVRLQFGLTEPPAPTPKEILKATADEYGLSVSEIIGESRMEKLVAARHTAIGRIKKTSGWSLARIGRLMGNRDHTTILFSVRKYEAGLVLAPSAFFNATPVRVFGNPRSSKFEWTREKYARLAEMRQAGTFLRVIAEELGCTIDQAKHAWNRLKSGDAKVREAIGLMGEAE